MLLIKGEGGRTCMILGLTRNAFKILILKPYGERLHGGHVCTCKINIAVYYELVSVDYMRMGLVVGTCKHVIGHSGFRKPEVLTR